MVILLNTLNIDITMGKQLFTDWAMIFGIYMYLCNAKEVGLFVTFDDNTDAHKFAGVHTQYVDPSSLFGSLPETEKKTFFGNVEPAF